MSKDEYPDKINLKWSKEEAVLNIRKYCAFQERCHKEFRYTLIEHAIYGDLLEEIISDLISNNFLDEERFARTFARGKFRMKQWGRNKIKQELKIRDVSAYSINIPVSEIHDDDYMSVLSNLILKKERTSAFKNQFDNYRNIPVSGAEYRRSVGHLFPAAEAGSLQPNP